MKHLSLLVPIVALYAAGLLSCSVVHAQSYLYSDGERYPYGSDGIRDSLELLSPWHSTPNPTPPPSSSSYGNPYSSLYGDNQQGRSQPSYELPAPVTKDFNVWKDGKPTLCTQTKHDVYCY